MEEETFTGGSDWTVMIQHNMKGVRPIEKVGKRGSLVV